MTRSHSLCPKHYAAKEIFSLRESFRIKNVFHPNNAAVRHIQFSNCDILRSLKIDEGCMYVKASYGYDMAPCNFVDVVVPVTFPAQFEEVEFSEPDLNIQDVYKKRF